MGILNVFVNIKTLHLSELTKAREEMRKSVEMMKKKNNQKERLLSIENKKEIDLKNNEENHKQLYIHQDRYLKPVKPRKLYNRMKHKKHKKRQKRQKKHKKAKKHKKHKKIKKHKKHKKHHRERILSNQNNGRILSIDKQKKMT